MKRSVLLCLALACASCAANAAENAQPESLAMTETATVTDAAVEDLMVFEIAGERLELSAGICNTHDNGTFHFALAEGPLGETGRVTATIERFQSGIDQDIVIAIEGSRDDGSSLSWYARSSLPVHDLDIALFASALEGSAVFDSEGGDDAPGTKAPGTFAIRCSGSEPVQP